MEPPFEQYCLIRRSRFSRGQPVCLTTSYASSGVPRDAPRAAGQFLIDLGIASIAGAKLPRQPSGRSSERIGEYAAQGIERERERELRETRDGSRERLAVRRANDHSLPNSKLSRASNAASFQ